MYQSPIPKIIWVTNNQWPTKSQENYKNKHLFLKCLQVDWAQQGSSMDTGLDCSQWELADLGWIQLAQLSLVSCISSPPPRTSKNARAWTSHDVDCGISKQGETWMHISNLSCVISVNILLAEANHMAKSTWMEQVTILFPWKWEDGSEYFWTII